MRLDAIRHAAPAAVCGLALLGCATPIAYGPIGETSQFGYSDMRNDVDSSYTVRVVAASAQQAHEFWDRRAAELCGGPNFRKNIFRAEIPVVSYTGYAPGPNGYGGSYSEDRYGPLILEGYLHCEGEAQAPASEGAAAPAPTPADAGLPPPGSGP
jgi:hypothetical protein